MRAPEPIQNLLAGKPIDGPILTLCFSNPVRLCKVAMLTATAWLVAAQALALTIQSIEPTPLFPKPGGDGTLRQEARLQLDNPGTGIQGTATIKVGNASAYTENLGRIAPGRSTNVIHITDVSAAATLSVELLDGSTGQSLAKHEMQWQPQKKWKIFCISYSHHDLGFGNYPHRLRTEIRHANIERPLKYCAETDTWDDDSRFRFVIETSEPITSFLSTHSASDAAELARRIREGRIQVGGVLATVNTEQLGHELMARLFYLSGRHTPDLLGVPRGRTALIDDVIGLSWPFATALKEAGMDYLFHGYNGCGHCLKPAEFEPVFYWQGPDRDPRSKVLVRSVAYGGYAGDSLGDGTPATVEKAIATLGKQWPYDALLLQEGTDFQLVTRDSANKIRDWNSRYHYPHLVCATLDMFFNEIAAKAKASEIKTFAKDGNNEWADQDSNDAWLLGHARKLGEEIPAAEKLATITGAIKGGAYPWTELYQAYHRLLLYHEHTDAIDFIAPQAERMRQYETELVENREMVLEAQEFCRDVTRQSLEKLASLVTTSDELNLVVFNSLPHSRTDLVRFQPKPVGDAFQIIDGANGDAVPHQVLGDGTCLFVARDVPATGYKTFSLRQAKTSIRRNDEVGEPRMESRFYRLSFNPKTGAITSIYDKEQEVELVDQSAPHQFNEYLYERIEKHGSQVTSVWHRVESARLSAVAGPVADVMTVTATAKGVENMTQTVVLYHDLKRIDFALDMVKSPSGRKSRNPNTDVVNKESVYVALPFAVPDFRFTHELPGGVAEPIRDQFDGSCTAFYAVRHFSDVSDDRFGVTVSPVENSLVEYDYPRSCPIPGGKESEFEREMRYPGHSRMYLYLLNNMFDVNVRWDQPGPMHFSWSLRSHRGNWQQGQADEFGWGIHNPLLAHLVRGPGKGSWPASASFLKVDAPNVVCTTIKPAEANGTGYILRFHETRGRPTDVSVSLPFLPGIVSARETDLVENDTSRTLQVSKGSEVAFSVRPFGIKTIRVVCAVKENSVALAQVIARPISDMQVKLDWSPQPGSGYYRVYRGEKADFKPSLLSLVGRVEDPSFLDQPKLHYGGWINNRLKPESTYYYSVAAVDRANHEGPLSLVVSARTLAPAQSNMPPLKVESLRATLVSPLAPFNFVNLLFRTSCEPDVEKYEIHRATEPGFHPDGHTRIGLVDSGSLIKGSGAYGHVPIDYPAGAYDHLMYEDTNVQPHTVYYYRVCAVDGAGQKGPFSAEASVRTGTASPAPIAARASSVYSPEYGPGGAVDGSEDPAAAWISKPFGGGTKENPADAWLEVELPRPIELTGITIVGDHRTVIPLQKGLQVDIRNTSGWVTMARVSGATERDIRCRWEAPKTVTAIRIFVPAAQLPKSERPDIPDGVVRVVELLGQLPDGTEAPLCEVQ